MEVINAPPLFYLIFRYLLTFIFKFVAYILIIYIVKTQEVIRNIIHSIFVLISSNLLKNHKLNILALYLALIAYLTLPFNIFAQNESHQFVNKRPHWIDFYQERIMITCNNSEVEVEGTYYMRNMTKGHINMTIQYPFPVDKYHPFPHEIDVEGYEYWKDSTNIYVNLSIEPEEKKEITVFYKQSFHVKNITFILSSGQNRNRPLQKTDFIIKIPANWKEVTLSYKPDRIETIKNKCIYYISRDEFLPKENLIIEWK